MLARESVGNQATSSDSKLLSSVPPNIGSMEKSKYILTIQYTSGCRTQAWSLQATAREALHRTAMQYAGTAAV